MLTNIEARDNLRGLARLRGRDFITRSINPLLEKQAVEEGWIVERKLKRSVRLKKAKEHSVLLEDRVWTLLFRMGFSYLSGEGGGILEVNPKEINGPTSQIDVVAMDGDVAVAIECKSAAKPLKRPQFQEELGKHSLVREAFSKAVSQQYRVDHKRQVALAMFTSNIVLSDNDRERARTARNCLKRG